MSSRKLIESELEAVKNDREVSKAFLENAQKNLSENVLRVPKHALAIKPKTYRKSVRMRLDERFEDFINRLKMVFGL